MLVSISKGIVNVTPKLFTAVLSETDSVDGYMISLVSNTYEDSQNKGLTLKYGILEEVSYNEDFQKLKDCFVDICRRQDINMYNENATPIPNRAETRANRLQAIINARPAIDTDIQSIPLYRGESITSINLTPSNRTVRDDEEDSSS